MKTRHLLAAITLALLPLTAACNGSTDDPKPSPSKTATPAPAADPTTEEPAPEYTPDTSDFLMTVKTTQRQCFGYGVGCNVTVEPDVTYIGTDTIDPDKTYSLTYEIHGDESGPVIDTLTLSNGTDLHYHSSMLSTAGSYTKISIEITDVEETL